MEEVKKTACSICMAGCPIDAHVEQGILTRVEGGRNTPFESGGLCAKGAAAKQYLYHKDRVRTPMLQVGSKGSGDFKPISWEEALEIIAQKLGAVRDTYGARSAVFYAGYPKWLRPALARLANGYGSPNFCTQSSTCFQADFMAWNTLFGGGPCYPDMANAKTVLQWTANPDYSAPARSGSMAALRAKGVSFITVDPRHTLAAHSADLHLRLLPGTDGALALSMAYVILTEDLYDHAFVAQWVEGFEAYRDYVMEFPPERGEAITGVPAGDIRSAARLYAVNKPSAIQFSASSLIHTVNGVQNSRAVYALMAITGNYDVQGGNRIHAMPWTPINEQRARLVRNEPGLGDTAFPLWAKCCQETQAIQLASCIETGRPYPIKAVFAMGLNHHMWPKPSRLLDALKSLPFFVNTELFLTDTCLSADLVLPAASSFEREELKCYGTRLYLTQKAVEPLGSCKNDIEIIQAAARCLNVTDPLLSGSYEDYLRFQLEPTGVTLEELRAHPEGLNARNIIPPETEQYRTHGFPTPSGKVELCSSVLKQLGYDGLPVYHDFRDVQPGDRTQYPMILNSGAARPHLFNTRLHRMPWIQTLERTDAVELHPEDAARMGIAEGERVILSTPTGRILGTAWLNWSMMRGVVGMYHGNPDADVNELIPDDVLDPISGFPAYKTCFCRVDKEAGI